MAPRARVRYAVLVLAVLAGLASGLVPGSRGALIAVSAALFAAWLGLFVAAWLLRSPKS